MSLSQLLSTDAIFYFVTLFFYTLTELIDPLSALPNETIFNAFVPDDFVQSFVSYNAEEHLGAELVKKVPQNFHQHQVSSDFTVGGFVLKWALIVLTVLTPLALFPLLFLFVRNQAKVAEEDDEADDDESNSPSTGGGQKQQLKSLKGAIHLWPTIAQTDAYLNQKDLYSKLTEVKGKSIVQVNASTGESHYLLDAKVSMQSSLSGQLYHLPSGLVFSPIHQYIYQPDACLYVNILNGELSAPQANHVYNRETNKLYERCLGLGYNFLSSTFYIPPQPVIQENQQTLVVAIRRLLPEELTDSYRPMYEELLKNEKSDKLNQFVKHDNQENGSNQKYSSLPAVDM